MSPLHTSGPLQTHVRTGYRLLATDYFFTPRCAPGTFARTLAAEMATGEGGTMQRRGPLARRASVLLLLISFLLPYATIVRADGPAVASLPIPVGPGTLTNARISGPLLVWQDPTGVFGVDLSKGQPLPIQGNGGSD